MREEIHNIINNSPATQINLNEMGISDNEIEEIAIEIKKKKANVNRIFLQKNQITDQGVMILSKEFSSPALPDLSFIDLQFNRIDKAGANALFTLKLSHSNLTIALHGNLISNTNEIQQIEDEVANRKNDK